MNNEPAELSIIVPVFNERGNVDELLSSLEKNLAGLNWEVIFVDDDSPDDTAAHVRQHGRRNPRVRCIQRLGRRGLSAACIEGMLASSAPYLAVMDGDLQHDESLLPQMLAMLKQDNLDIVVGSRYVAGGSAAGLNADRAAISRLATRLSRRFIPQELRDPMSGFFMLRREVFDDNVRNLSGFGFKILLDIFASAKRELNFVELPFEFRDRRAGQSKLDNQVAWDFFMLLADKLFGRAIPVRFLSFILVGGSGVFVHMAVLTVLIKVVALSFFWSQTAATVVAMTSNYALNNVITYRDLQLRGIDWLRGWLTFSLACSIGAVANIGIAEYLFRMDTSWPVAGIAGVLVGAVWNYVITRAYTWKVGAPARR